jgi:hypothetical protein
MHYEIIEIQENTENLLEQLGSKRKFWFTLNNEAYLFKEGREGTGENWAEVVASEICSVLGIPSATYCFATYKERLGVITKTIVPNDGLLVHGNELLAKFIANYEETKLYKQKQYTLRSVIAFLKKIDSFVKPPYGWKNIESISTTLDTFIGYLMLDALIGNQDRHHENWGVVFFNPKEIYLAHTFDHASSLGRNESDKTRTDILQTRDTRRSLDAYVSRARSAFYSSGDAGKRIGTHEAFIEISRQRPDAAKAWLSRLDLLSAEKLVMVFEKIPKQFISKIAIDFSISMILANIQKLKNPEEST